MTNPEYAEQLGTAIETAARDLPDGWTIKIVIERESGVVELYDDDGNSLDLPTNGETMAEAIEDAVEFANQFEEYVSRLDVQAAENAGRPNKLFEQFRKEMREAGADTARDL